MCRLAWPQNEPLLLPVDFYRMNARRKGILRKSERIWFRGLFGGCISAAAGAGSAFLGMTGAHALGVDVPSLNLKSLGVLLLTNGLLSAFLYLKESPLPPYDEDTTIVVKETKTQEFGPNVAVQTKITETSKVKSSENPEDNG